MDFVYETRDPNEHIKRTTQDGGQFDKYLLPDYQEFRPTGGNTYTGRIAPPTWKGPNGERATHYGYEIWLNYKIGTDEGTYISRFKHGFPEQCAVQEMIIRLRADGAEKYKSAIKAISAKKRVLVWWLGRGQEHEGWKLWSMPWTVDKDIAKRAYMKGTSKVLLIDHHLDGYDVSFEVEGKGRNTKYTQVDVARMPSPIVEDSAELAKLMKFVVDNPLHECLKIYDYDYIKQLLAAVDVDELGEDREEDTDKDKAPGTPADASSTDTGGAIPEPKQQAEAPAAPAQSDDPGVGLDGELASAMDEDIAF